MKRLKRWIAIPAAALLVVTSGCFGAANDPASSGNGEQTGNAGERPPITITMFSSMMNTQWEDMQSPVGQKIKEITGVTLKTDYPVGDPMQKLSLMAASGEYPDLIFANNNINTIVEAGGLIDLAPLIEEHGPNIKKLYGD